MTQMGTFPADLDKTQRITHRVCAMYVCVVPNCVWPAMTAVTYQTEQIERQA